MDPEAEIAAWILVSMLEFLFANFLLFLFFHVVQLSELCTAQENFADALDNLEEARKIADKESFCNDLKRIHCLMGIAKGTLEFGQYCGTLSFMNSVY
jgi:hypothetical protein